MRRIVSVAAASLLLAGLVVVQRGGTAASAEAPIQEFVGALHNHSGYSDGWPGTIPADYYASGKGFGLDFLSGSEHSDTTNVPVTFSDGCLGPLVTNCVAYDTPNSLRKWDATLEQARAATESGKFTGIRGFEWTSDRYGHINVYFSKNDTNAKSDGGYLTMDTFYNWFTRSASQGGGADGLATFNHPGAKNLNNPAGGDVDPPTVQNWNDFAYVPAADNRMVGIEVFNDFQEYGSRSDNGYPLEGYYVHALDKGWHVGAVGAEDLHGIPDAAGRNQWGGPQWAKTVILATDRSEPSLRAAMLARHFYAIRDNRAPRLELSFSVDGSPMGSRLVRAQDAPLRVTGAANRPTDVVEIVTSGGTVVASGLGSVDATLPAASTQRYYFMRVKENGQWIGYTSPVWVSANRGSPVGEWLAGDLHVHTCYSHDAYCGPDDYNTGPEDFYTLSGSVDERFTEASVRGLDYLAITDHHDDAHPEDSGQRSVNDPGFGTHGVIGVPGYENSIGGHAQMLGATHVYSAGNKQAADINAMADALRADGGVFQANHPADDLDHELDSTCSDTSTMHWKYGFDVRLDTVEVWNISQQLQPPLPAGTSNQDAMQYWECWLDRGYHVAATGGSDSHWLSTSLIQGPGNPTTWVFSGERSAAGVLRALREGRTSISVNPPAEGGLQLFLEADADRDGTYESIVGDDVGPNTPMRVRATGLPGGGLVQVRANGATLVDGATLVPGGELRFTAPSTGGWVRATLLGPDATAERRSLCNDALGSQTTYCRNHILVLALTSPMYVVAPVVATTLTYVGQTRAHGETIDLAAQLDTEAGAPLAGRPVEFTILGNTVSATTDGAGIARATTTVPDHGHAQNVDVRFAGDKGYGPSQVSATITWGNRPE